MKLKMPYCVSFTQIPDNEEAIDQVRQELFA